MWLVPKYAITLKSLLTGIKNGNSGNKMDVKGIVCGKCKKLLLSEPRI